MFIYVWRHLGCPQGGAAGSWWGQPRDAAEGPAVHRSAPTFCPYVNDAKVENPALDNYLTSPLVQVDHGLIILAVPSINLR